MSPAEESPGDRLRRDNPDLILSEPDLSWFIYSTHISLRHKFIFVETPKAACSTMKLTLQRLEVGDAQWDRWGLHLHDRQFSPLLTPLQVPSFARLREDGQIKKFCVIRCPYVRLLSAYLDKICRNQPQKAAVMKILGRADIDEPITFEDFVGAVSSQHPRDMDPHWKPQTMLLNYDALSYDLILRVETLDSDIKRLSRLLGCDLSPFYTRMEGGRTDASAKMEMYYSEKHLMDTVARIYANDVALFAAASQI